MPEETLIVHLPNTPDGVDQLKKETARVHAGAVLWYLDCLDYSAEQKIEILKRLRELVGEKAAAEE